MKCIICGNDVKHGEGIFHRCCFAGVKNKDKIKDFFELREELAKLEHEQWAHWMKYVLGMDYKTIYKNVRKWNNQANTDYKDLSEKEKQSDRVWADKVLLIIEKRLFG